MRNNVYKFTIMSGTIFWLNTEDEIKLAKNNLNKEYNKNRKFKNPNIYAVSDPKIIEQDPSINLTPVGVFSESFIH